MNEINKLVLEYCDFRMNKEKAEFWFDELKHIEEKTFASMILEYLRHNKKPPNLCDFYSKKLNFYEG